jgi:hypothetical protein
VSGAADPTRQFFLQGGLHWLRKTKLLEGDGLQALRKYFEGDSLQAVRKCFEGDGLQAVRK